MVYLFSLFLLQNIDCGYSLATIVFIKNIRNIKVFLMKSSIFPTDKIHCLLHGYVFVMFVLVFLFRHVWAWSLERLALLRKHFASRVSWHFKFSMANIKLVITATEKYTLVLQLKEIDLFLTKWISCEIIARERVIGRAWLTKYVKNACTVITATDK